MIKNKMWKILYSGITVFFGCIVYNYTIIYNYYLHVKNDINKRSGLSNILNA